jgi:hypothetical protein
MRRERDGGEAEGGGSGKGRARKRDGEEGTRGTRGRKKEGKEVEGGREEQRNLRLCSFQLFLKALCKPRRLKLRATLS